MNYEGFSQYMRETQWYRWYNEDKLREEQLERRLTNDKVREERELRYERITKLIGAWKDTEELKKERAIEVKSLWHAVKILWSL